MSRFLMVLVFAGLLSCDNSADVKKELDTFGKQVDSSIDKALNSEFADSVRSKGGKLVEGVKTKGGEL